MLKSNWIAVMSNHGFYQCTEQYLRVKHPIDNLTISKSVIYNFSNFERL